RAVHRVALSPLGREGKHHAESFLLAIEKRPAKFRGYAGEAVELAIVDARRIIASVIVGDHAERGAKALLDAITEGRLRSEREEAARLAAEANRPDLELALALIADVRAFGESENVLRVDHGAFVFFGARGAQKKRHGDSRR